MAGVLLLLAAALSEPGPFVLANGAGSALEDLSIRASDGRSEWRTLGAGRLSLGARASMPAPAQQLCAYDLRARVEGTLTTWSSVNLCDVRSVTLNRRSDGTLWVDYD